MDDEHGWIRLPKGAEIRIPVLKCTVFDMFTSAGNFTRSQVEYDRTIDTDDLLWFLQAMQHDVAIVDHDTRAIIVDELEKLEMENREIIRNHVASEVARIREIMKKNRVLRKEG